MSKPIELPIEGIKTSFLDAVRTSPHILIHAPPGAGKSTRLPLWLLADAVMDGQRILLIQPRRLAASNVARYLAAQTGQAPGKVVGLRTRDEQLVCPSTRLEVVTEGVFIRMIQSDPALEGVGAILFDEFHERSVQIDVGLSLALASQELFRDQASPLAIIVMSATLAVEPLLALLPNAKLLASEGRVFPVETYYQPLARGTSMAQHLSRLVFQALQRHPGDILVFLPGMREIRQLQRLVESQLNHDEVKILPLHASLPAAAQRAALAPATGGSRKVVLSTNVAETSLTIEGVQVVIDSGLVRRAEFDPGRGVTNLVVSKVSQASADQRRGRAGRVSAGHCYRAWGREAHGRLARADSPELVRCDLSAVLLEAALYGEPDLSNWRLLDYPSESQVAQAWTLLSDLGAVDRNLGMTGKGRDMVSLGLSPRLAALCVDAKNAASDQLPIAVAAAVILNEPALAGPANVDFLALFRQLLPALKQEQRSEFKRRFDRLLRRLGGGVVDLNQLRPEGLPQLLIPAFTDRIARQRSQAQDRYLLANGQEVMLRNDSQLWGLPWLLVLDYQRNERETLVKQAMPLSETDVLNAIRPLQTRSCEVSWCDQRQQVIATERIGYGALILTERNIEPAAEQRTEVLKQLVLSKGLQLFDDPDFYTLQARINWLRSVGVEGIPDFSDAALLASIDEWLVPYLVGIRMKADLKALSIVDLLAASLSWELRQVVDQLAPAAVRLPTGFDRKVDYRRLHKPVLAAKIQELYGLAQTPVINQGKTTLLVELLSPAGRPVQLTDDLSGFWQNTYLDVKKELKGRYPKHFWPDDPVAAKATTKTTKNM